MPLTDNAAPKDLVNEYLGQLEAGRFWGCLVLKYEDGKIVYVRQEQGFRPDDLPLSKGSKRHEQKQL